RESDLGSVMKAGRRLRTEHLEVRTVTSLLLHMRLAVVVAKHGHTIVERNRLRRRLRELARVRMLPLHSGMDVVVRSLPGAYDAPFSVLGEEIDRISNELIKQGSSS
ncbi:MAG: ribonuclease P protein component, partial [Gemmatimonadales bacterium]